MLKQVICGLFLLLSHCFCAAERIGVLSLSVGQAYSQLVEKAIVNKREYCDRHGYDFICGYESLDQLRHPAWSKIKLIEQYLPKYDWIFWSDADSVVMNMDFLLEDVIDDQYIMIVGDTVAGINTGQFLIKNCSDSFELLKECYALEQFIDHPWWENKAIIDHLERHSEVASRVKLIPQRVFNSGCIETFGANVGAEESVYHEGDFIIHFAAARGEFLKELIQKYLKLKLLSQMSQESLVLFEP